MRRRSPRITSSISIGLKAEKSQKTGERRRRRPREIKPDAWSVLVDSRRLATSIWAFAWRRANRETHMQMAAALRKALECATGSVVVSALAFGVAYGQQSPAQSAPPPGSVAANVN